MFKNRYTKEGPGVTKESLNKPRILQFFDILGTRFWHLIVLNLIYIVFCIPIITIGPATAGLTKVLRNWSRHEHAFVWGDFWETFKKNFKPALLLGIANTLIGGYLIFCLLFFWQNELLFLPRELALAVIIFTAVIFVMMNYYSYTMLITFRLTFRQLIKNCFIFTWVGFLRNVAITAIIALVVWIFTLFMRNPFVWIIYFLLFFAFCGFIITFMVYPLIKKHMIDNVNPETGERIDQQENK